MERLAWLEILDRHGDVVSRHPVHAWPLRVGRAYSNDVVLDDPHAAAHHAEIRRTHEGLYEFTCVESLNGLQVKHHRGKKHDVVVSGDDIVRIGHTQLRVRPLDYPVADETVLPRAAWLQGWIGLIAATLLFVGVELSRQWLEYTRADAYAILVSPVLSFIPGLLLWVGVWSLVGRIVSGRARFIAHAVIALLAFTFFDFLIRLLMPYLEFAFDSEVLASALAFVAPVVLGSVAYAHLRRVSRMRPRKLAFIVTGLVGVLVGYLYLDNLWSEDDRLGEMDFSRALGPARMLLAQPQSSEAFLKAADKLKARADK